MKYLLTYRKISRWFGKTATIIIGLWAVSLFGQEIRVMEYGVNSGLPQDYVYSLHQDESGYLWIGTGNGLARYDGISFRVFTDVDSLCDNFITASQNHLGESWFGHRNGGISHYNGKTFTKIVSEEQAMGMITDMKSMGNDLWASTQSGGIWRIGPDFKARLYSDPENDLTVFSIEFLSTTECAIGSMEGVLVYAIEYETHELRLIAALEGLPETKVQDLVLSKDNATLYILTQDEGIYTYNIRQFTPQTETLGIDMEAGIEGPQQLFEDLQGNLWIPTFGNGVFKLVREEDGVYRSWVTYNQENGLNDNNLKVVFEDREENIWLGMYGTGLARLVDEAYSYYVFDEEVSDNNIHSIYATAQLLWFGTEKGLIQFDRPTGKTTVASGRAFGLPDDRVTAITGSAEGDLWIGTDQQGVYHMIPSRLRFQRIPISEGTLENSINALEYTDPFLWIATDKGVCKIDTRSGVLRWFTLSNAGLPHNTVNYLQADETGKIWLSTLSNTVSYIENDSVTRLIIPTVGGAVNIRSISHDRDGHIWVGTYGNGVFKMEGDSASNFTTASGLISDYCYSLVGDDSRYIWVSHRGGLSRISLADGHISPIQEDAGIDRSMEFNLNAAFKDAEGTIWFGSTDGVLAYHPKLAKSQSPPPSLSITSVVVNNESKELEEFLILPPGRHDLRIHFVGVNLKNPQGVTYRYKMEGLGNAWSEEFLEDQVMFNKLPDGKYIFQLNATNSEGITSEAVVLPITIRKPLWKRWWFWGILLIVVGSGIVAYIKRREYNLRMEKQILEKAVRERTQEVVEQKEEIELQRDAIKAQNDQINLINQNITDSIVYARRIQNALFPPTEHLANFFPDSFVFNRPQYIVSGDFFWVARNKEKLVVTVSDCTGHGVPGAFMSMLGVTLLNEIVNNQNCVESDEILNRLKNEIIKALRQEDTGETSSDGMDMALCVYDPPSSTLMYAGGFNPLVLIRNGELIKYRADPMPIGIGALKGRDFTSHKLKMKKGDVIYLYTDGYEDQFGGEKDKKFSRKQFRELLMEVHELPMSEQRTTLEKRLDEWMDGREQIDDITVMGIRL